MDKNSSNDEIKKIIQENTTLLEKNKKYVSRLKIAISNINNKLSLLGENKSMYAKYIDKLDCNGKGDWEGNNVKKVREHMENINKTKYVLLDLQYNNVITCLNKKLAYYQELVEEEENIINRGKSFL